jgi:hypothetical protein
MERRDLYQDDLTEEREPSPATRADVADSERLDPVDADESAEDELND